MGLRVLNITTWSRWELFAVFDELCWLPGRMMLLAAYQGIDAVAAGLMI
jgi:hypothetical protein